MNKAFKCAKCSNIQLKGKRCVDDGAELVECDLDVENTIDRPFDSPMVEHEENEFIRNIRIASDLKNPKNIQQPERNYVKNFIKLELPKKPKILDYLNICFLNQDHSRRDDIYHKIDNWTPGSNVLFVTISVYIPLEYAESNQLYYYYFLQENEKNSIKLTEENNLLVNKKLRSYDSKKHFSVDGLVWFQNKDEKGIKKMKRESIIYHMNQIFDLIMNDPLVEHRFFLSRIKTIQESLCTESDYKEFFHEAVENELNDLLRYMKKKPRLPENVKTIWTITILFISHKYDLKNFPSEYQFKFLLKQLLFNMVDFFEFIFSIFVFEEKKIICDIFEKYLHKNFQYSYQDVLTLLLFYYNSLENINQKENASIRNYRNFPLKLDCSDNIKKILCFGSISQNINKRTFFELIKNLWPILVLKNEHSLIFIHYLCDSNLTNLKTLLDCNQLTSNMLLNYLYYLIEPTTDTETKQLSPKSKEYCNEILCYLIKEAMNNFNKFIDDKNHACRNSLWLKNFNPEVCLLEYLIEKGNFDFELVSKLTHLSLIRNQMKFIISNECELPPNNEYNHILKQIKILLMNQLEDCEIDENYALVSNDVEVNNKSDAFIFDKMLSISCYSIYPKLINNNYISFILGILSDQLKISSFEHVAEKYFCFDFKSLINKEVIQIEFENALIEKLVKRSGNVCYFAKFSRNRELLEKLTDKFLDKNLTEHSDLSRIFLTCPVYKNFFEEFLKGNQCLSERWKENFKKIFDSYCDLIQRLIEGKIKIYELKFLNEQRENFENMSNLIFTFLPKHDFSKYKANFVKIKKLIEIRLNEWMQLNKCLDILVFFLQFCTKSKNFTYGSYKSLLHNLEIIRNNRSTRINEFCEPIGINEAFSDSPAKITSFDEISYKHFEQMDKIRSLNQLKLVLFDHFFVTSFKEKSELKTILVDILPNALKSWDSLACSIDSASIKLNEIEHFLNIHFDKNVKKCQDELVYIIEYFKKPNRQASIVKLETYFKFRECFKLAKIINKICTEFEIEKEYEELKELLIFKSDEFENFDLNKMDDRVQKLIKTLEKYSTMENVECLEAFVNSKNIINWIKNNVGDLNELKFFVDLISLTKSSEIQNSTDKNIFAKTFKEATTAYAPLIFVNLTDLNYEQIFDRCIKVWNNLKNDSNIAKKLIEIKDMVDFLEEINKKRGNVELSAIEQARQINEKGLFTIELVSNQLKVQKMIQVNVTMINKINNTQKEEVFDHEKLNELKSILVLLTRKSGNSAEEQEDANTLDYFIQIFDNCIRLASTFVTMCQNGCEFFNNLKMNLYSDSQNTRLNNQPIIELVFNQGQTIADNRQPSLQILNEFCSKMENFLNEWTKYVEMVRDEYHFINYFTMNQVILIKSSLERALYNQNIDSLNFDLIMSMLHNVNDNLEINSFVQVATNLLGQTRNLKFKPIFDRLKNKNKLKKIEEIREYAKDKGFSIKSVKDAYDKFGDFNEEMFNYCLTNDFEGYDESVSYRQLSDIVENLTTSDHVTISEHSFCYKLENSLENFIQKQNNLCSNINLSIERFAIFLEILYRLKEDEKFCRQVPGYLIYRGKPNLITCSHQRDQIGVVLSIYAHTHNAPLPSNDEVLFCNSQTTAEEIENFFRIAFRSNGKKIYTLLNIQELSYNNSFKVEKFLSSKTNLNQTDNYVIVCICSTDRLQHSLLASSLAKNKVSPIVLNEGIINEYIMLNMRTDSNISLAKYDKDRSTVRALISQQAANGKSTYVEVFKNSITNFKANSNHVIIRIKTSSLVIDNIFEKLFKNKSSSHTTIYHIDIANEVFENVDLFIFNLIFLNYLKHSDGRIWRRSVNDIYFIEIMPQFIDTNSAISYHSTLNYLPRIMFKSPRNYLYHIANIDAQPVDNWFESLFFLEKYQRCANYLKIFMESVNQIGEYSYSEDDFLDQEECLQTLLNYSNLRNPNWADLNNFVNFLDMQLDVLEKAPIFENNQHLKSICTRLIILMSRDFGIPSLNIGDEREVIRLGSNNEIRIELDKLAISRRWENLSHPYIIVNENKQSFTFMGIYLDRRSYKFKNPNTGNFMDEIEIDLDANARIALLKSQVQIYDNFNDFGRTKQIQSLRKVMGLEFKDKSILDPDPTYELTLDNCLKLMAIYMRLRCKIPVVIMGETGCGKTRKLKFLSDLHIDPNLKSIKHLIHFKVHGGTSFEDIEKKIEQAERLSIQNYQKMFNSNQNCRNTSAILFIDEANTTDAIGLIKEIMCDGTCNGRNIDFNHGLRIVAAVNPYRKHSDEMIQKLEDAGLGFYVSSGDSKEKIGQIPMRQLVYRVQPLPASMLSLVWDFGQLNTDTEKKYIDQMINKTFKNENSDQKKELSELLTECQRFMRNRNDECSFVSLRDVERVIRVTCWFISKIDLIFDRMNQKNIPSFPDNSYQINLPHLKRAFLLALAVCYHSSLFNMQTRLGFRQLIASKINVNFTVDFDWVLAEILKCQHVFLDEINLANNIARNHALLENVFMIIVCIELRIPLFIVGKPGSSKSLAKSIVESSMHGLNSNSFLFQNLKETYFLNFQCSPLTKADMIIRTFEEAASFQENNDLNNFVSVINLDEVGLAEASESMPLKTLHPLLEDGSDSSDSETLPHQKVAVIGISNWALDPAKMNRGIFVSRSDPDISELVESAKGICKYDRNIYAIIEPYITQIATAYLQVCAIAKQYKREFFGLRDFYSLIKMLYWFCMRDGRLTWNKLEHSVKRNFDGLNIDLLKPFKDQLYSQLDKQYLDTDPLCDSIDLIKAALKGENVESNSRYLLLITENYSVSEIIQNYLVNSLRKPAYKIVVIFGSSFKHDMEYTEICKNISKIKHSMEVGNTVILLNFQNLFESLYDVLNQYYQVFGGQRYVYLGINTQRVNCLVHEEFRMIILSNKESVYDSKIFPIPLINRLEKHFLNSATMLNQNQLHLCKELQKWMEQFSSIEMGIKLSDIFIGYHDDTLASIILYLIQKNAPDFSICENSFDLYDTDSHANVLSKAKKLIIQCSTLDNLYRAINKNFIDKDYLNHNSHHFSLASLLKTKFQSNEFDDEKNLLQVTTHSKLLLTRKSLALLAHSFSIPIKNVSSCLLKSFDTENQFSKKISDFLSQANDEKSILIVQCDFSKKFESDLLACARHSINEKLKEAIEKDVNILRNSYIVLLINFPRQFSSKFVGYQVSQWSCHHVDELDDSADYIHDLNNLRSKSLSKILTEHSTGIDLRRFFRILAHQSCSMIDDTNISRTIERIGTFNTICDANEQFFNAVLARLISLQEDKEKMFPQLSESWFNRELATYRRINEYSTMRKSVKNYLETKLSPLLAYLLSKIDVHSNLDSLNENCSWKCHLFIDIMENTQFLKINYTDMRDESNGKELNRFFCKSDIFKKEYFTSDQRINSTMPFFWIINQQLNSFCQSYLDGISKQMDESEIYDHFMRTIPNLFENTIVYKILNKNINSSLVQQVFDLYLNDFVLISCNVNNKEQMSVVKKAIEQSLKVIDTLDLTISFPLIHLVYKLMEQKIQFFLKFSTLEPNICHHVIKKSNFENLEIESCLFAIEDLVRETQDLNNLHILSKKLKSLINLSRNVILFAKSKAELGIYKAVCQKVDSFKFLNLFHNDVCFEVESFVAPIYQDLLVKIKLNIIRNKFDFSKHETIEIINEFLLFCVKMVKKKCFLEFSDSACCKTKCSTYKKLNTKDCKCFVCSDCEHKMKLRMVNHSTVCLACRKQINVKLIDNQIGVKINQIQDYVRPYKKFMEKLNLFYLNVVEHLIFNSSPDVEVIKSVLKVALENRIASDELTFELDERTKKLLFQLIFKNYQKSHNFLNQWFDVRNQDQIEKDNNSEVALNFLHCVEETLFIELIDKSIDEEINAAQQVTQYLASNNQLESILRDQTQKYTIESLSYLAKLKFVLKILAKATNNPDMMDSIKSVSQLNLLYSNIRSLIEPTLDYTNIVYNFLIKELVRRYSFSSIKFIANNRILNWMTPKKIIGDNLEISDRYILTGNKYKNLKKAIKSAFENRNSTEIENALAADTYKMLPYFLICIYKNVILLQQNIDIQSCDIINSPYKKFYPNKGIYLNEISQMSQNITGSIELNLLLLQLKYSIRFSRNTLISPLADLIESPAQFKASFIPCMPHDTIFENFLALRQTNSNDNPTLYACPNGHPYILFDVHHITNTTDFHSKSTLFKYWFEYAYSISSLIKCGRPWEITKCQECNENIGGRNHVLCPGNTRLDAQDRTQLGYCLPSANSQNDNPANQRLLRPAHFHILRFIIHSILYLAVDSRSLELIEIMHTKPLDLKDFFWLHIQKDLRIISHILNLNIDDVLILLHLISDKMLSSQSTLSSSYTKWQSKDERQKYEKEFGEHFIDSILESYENKVANANLELQQDANNNNDEIQKVYFIAYEKTGNPENDDSNQYQREDFWKFQPLCDYNVFKIKLALTEQNKHKILKYLVENEYRIKLVKNLSHMMKLINNINDGYYKRLPKHILANTSIKECVAKGIISKSFASENLEHSIQAFQHTWFNSKQYFQKYAYQKFELASKRYSEDFEFNMDTNLSYILPSKNGDGLISYILLHYLIDTQNELLTKFRNQYDENVSIETNFLEFKDNLVDFDPDTDFLRILKSNFIYDQKEAQYWFMFDNITNRVIDRYIKNKPIVQVNIPVFICSDEIDESNFYKSLDSIIKQELLDPMLQMNIFQEFTCIDEVADALNTMKILINYSKTIGALSNDCLSSLVKKIYTEQNIQSILKTNILEQCQLKHLNNIWLILLIKRAVLLTKEKLNPFENLSDYFIKDSKNEISLCMDRSKNFSLLFTLFQLIEYCSKMTGDDEIERFASLKLEDVLKYSENLDLFEVIEEDKLCEFFKDEQKMESIFYLWKNLVESANF